MIDFSNSTHIFLLMSSFLAYGGIMSYIGKQYYKADILVDYGMVWVINAMLVIPWLIAFIMMIVKSV